VIGEPPLLVGDVQLRLTPLGLAALAVRFCGAPGTVAGMAERLFEEGPVPIAFVAVTVKLYMVPFARPLTVQFRLALTQEAPPGEAVAL
jgi:hypothetical protein